MNENQFKIIKKEHLKTNKWSGGTTTELFKYPENSLFANRDFDVRISTATVEDEYSIFTPLPGIHRTLMVLEGEIELQHKNYHSIKLAPFQSDKFEGDWHTECFGKCVDFNLMTTKNTNGKIDFLQLDINDFFKIKNDLKNQIVFIHIYKGEASIPNLKTNIHLIQQDSLLLYSNELEMEFEIKKSSIIIIVKITFDA